MDRLLVPLLVVAGAAIALLVGLWATALAVNTARERRDDRKRRRQRRHRPKIDVLRDSAGPVPPIDSD